MFIGVLAVVFAIAAIAISVAHHRNGRAPAQHSSSGSPAGATCRHTARLAVPPAYAKAWARVVAAQGRHGCASVRLVQATSAAVVANHTGLDGWIPEDGAWLGRSGAPRPIGTPTPLAISPLVMATSPGMARALGGPVALASPTVLGPLVRLEHQVPAYAGHPAEPLKVAMPDPAGSIAGTLAFTAYASTAAGQQLAGLPNYVAPSLADLTFIRSEHRVVALSGDDAGVFDASGEPNLLLTSEAVALAHNAGATAPDTLSYLPGVALRMPLITLRAGAGPALTAFADFVGSTAGRHALAAAGLRPPDDSVVPTPTRTVDTHSFRLPPREPTPAQVTGLTTLFGALHLRVSSLVVADTSGSMNQPLPGAGGRSKIDLVRETVALVFRTASPQAHSGLMTFHSLDPTNRPDIVLRVPLAPNGARNAAGVSHLDQWINAIRTAPIVGGTPLYNAVMRAYTVANRAYQPGALNQIVVLSDGANRDTTDGITEQQMLRFVHAHLDPHRPVAITTIGIGADADMGPLRALSAATGGRSVWLPTYTGYQRVIAKALFAAP